MAGFDVAQALAIGNLRERHNSKVFRATKCSEANIAAILHNNAIKTRPGNKIQAGRSADSRADALRAGD
jgi:hypothetical protein